MYVKHFSSSVMGYSKYSIKAAIIILIIFVIKYYYSLEKEQVTNLALGFFNSNNIHINKSIQRLSQRLNMSPLT